ncbi:MAG: hypothetical protein AB1778_09185 [Candidatus Bipolaricaulota bacterium]
MEDVLQAIESFRRLAVLDPAAAGQVWMSSAVAAAWEIDMGRAVADSVAALALFGHAVPFARGGGEVSPPAGALYSPWVGALLVFSFDARASQVESYSILSAEVLTREWEEPAPFAVAAMDAIDVAFSQFRRTADGEDTSREVTAQDLRSAVTAASSSLESAYGLVERPTMAQANVATAVDALLAERLEWPLDLLDETSDGWRASLRPVWIATHREATFVVLASPMSPLDWVWLDVSAYAAEPLVRSVSLIRLYESLVTRGGGRS